MIKYEVEFYNQNRLELNESLGLFETIDEAIKCGKNAIAEHYNYNILSRNVDDIPDELTITKWLVNENGEFVDDIVNYSVYLLKSNCADYEERENAENKNYAELEEIKNELNK